MKRRIITGLCLIFLLATCLFIFTACGTQVDVGKSAYQTWLENGHNGSEKDFLNWLKGQDGTDGKDGVDGVTPTIEISQDGYWIINGVKTEYQATCQEGAGGTDGKDGVDGITPKIQINSSTKMWEVSYDNGLTWESLGVLATPPEQKITSISVGGIDISTFKIYAVNSTLSSAVRNYFTDLLGVTLEVSNTAPTSGQKGYVIIDQTELVENKYGVRIENGNVIVYGSYNSIETAVEYFCGDYFDAFFKKEINLRATDSVDKYTEKKEIYTKEELKTVLNRVYNETDAFIVGAMSSGGYSRELPSQTLENFYNATGQYPGMLGFEASTVGLQLSNKELDSNLRCVDETKTFLTEEQHSQLVCELVDYCAGGGIVTFSSHFVNPTEAFFNEGLKAPYRGNMGNKTSQEDYERAFKAVITNGHSYNTNFKQELDMNARLFKALQQNGIQVVYRPFQEMNASWFWWCVAQDITPLDDSTQTLKWVSYERFTDLWKYVYNYYTNTLGLDNLIWVFSPNNTKSDPVSGSSTTIMNCYPGDDYVDIVGVDWYTNGKRVEEVENGKCYYNLANASGKVAGLCEFGPSGSVAASTSSAQKELYSSLDQLADFTALIEQGYKFSYVLNWNGPWSIPYMGYGKEYMESEYTLSQEDVAGLFNLLR